MSESQERFGVLVSLAYLGRGFNGFARQPGQRTIAGELEGAIRSVDPKASLVRAVSRTDTGVHARDQRVAFNSVLAIEPRGWLYALNQNLPAEISAVRVAKVNFDFDPRGHAVCKTYRYTLLLSQVRDPFWAGLAWRVGWRLNQSLMREEAKSLEGTHDFRAFRSSSDQRTNTERTLSRVQIVSGAADPRCICVEVEGDRFLHRMVRIIVGTLVDVGRGRCPPGTIARGLASGSRECLGMTAPPDGLSLERMILDDEGTEPWPSQ